jgi:hypothetical protein
VDVDIVFEKAELLKALGLLECAGWQGGEALERCIAVCVEAYVLPVLRGGVVFGIAVEGDGGAGEVESAAIGGGDDFDGVGVGDVFWSAEDFEGGDFDVRLCEGAKERGEVLGFEEGFVALDVDVDVGVKVLGYGVDAVGAAGEVCGGELDGPVVAVTEFGYFFGVGGDDDAVELGTGDGGFEDPGEHGAAGDGAQDFTGEPCGGETRGNDAEHGRGLLFAGSGIKYDGTWLCRGDVSHSKRSLCRRNPFTHIGGVAQMVRATDS